jgi:ATP-dependent DNA helicase RecG
MSPSKVQHPLETPVTYIKRVGPRRANVFASMGINSVRDLFGMYPRKYLDRRSIVKIRDLWQYVDTGTEVTVVAVVRGKDVVRSYKKRERFILVVGDEQSFLDCIWFQRARTMEKIFRKGERLALSGQVTDFNNTLQMVHPAFDRLSSRDDEEEEYNWEDMFNTGRILPIYTETAEMKEVGLEGSVLRSIMLNAFEKYGHHIEEHLPSEVCRRRKLMEYRPALSAVHFPESSEDIQQSRTRLKYDELFFLQMLLGYRRRGARRVLGISFDVRSELARKLIERLPFELTGAQKRVIKEIAADMQSNTPMHRLLQGDVGSGKTIVSILSMLVAIDNGYQAVFMVPTEILAGQHYTTMRRLLEPIGIEPVLLIGGQKKTERKPVEESVAVGSSKLIIGTHALFQEHVSFHKLGLVIIDEQHRFGVMQRLRLYEKAKTPETDGRAPDLLVLTATPIPRTLSLTLYGDLDTSILGERPPGRKSVKTAVRSKSERDRVYVFARDQVMKGRQVYVVYPLIEQSEKIDLRAAKEGYEEFRKGIFKEYTVALLHGKMPRDENEDIMTRFRDGRIDVLVATTVIEVGVDVANATTMIIEHAERFGLSQLHQLRGRVGRGTDQSYCILLHYLSPYNKAAAFNRGSFSDRAFEKEDEKQKGMVRLETIASTDDGFKIAEVDLKLRGPGEFFGVRQSGFPELKLASLIDDRELLDNARADAFAIVERDPHLREPSHQSLRRHFEYHMKPLLDLTRAG